MQFRSLLSVAALSAVALAANNSTLTTATPDVKSACSFKDFTATESADVASVAACPTAVGDITIEGDAFGSIELTGVEQIYGDLIVQNATQAVQFNAATLQLVSGNLELNANTILASLNLAQLTTVGTFNLNALPALESTGLTSGITSAESVIISDTGLNSLEGINVVELKIFNVNNNGEIQTIDSGLQKVTDTLTISYNADSVDVKLDQLTSAKNINLQSISSFSAANLTQVTGSIAFYSSSLDKIEIKSLKNVANSLTIAKNDELEEIDFENLSKIGGALAITDNEKLESFAGFPELEKVGGSVVINGSFNNGSFESLESVAGGFNLRSTGDLTCEEFNSLNSDGDIKGDKYYCSGAHKVTSSSSSKSGNSNGVSTDSSSEDDSESSSSTKGSSSSKDAAGSIGGSLMAIVAGAAAIGLTLY